MAVFEASLDIRRLVEDHFKLNLLIDTLLTKKQRFLFHNQYAKVVELKEEDVEPQSDRS